MHSHRRRYNLFSQVKYHQPLYIACDDIETGNSSTSSRLPVVPEGVSTSDTKHVDHDSQHADFDTIDLPEESSHSEQSLSSTASFRTSRADLVGGTRTNNHPVSTACCLTRRRVKQIVGATLVTILAGIALLLCLYFVKYNHTNSNDKSQGKNVDSVSQQQEWTWTGDIDNFSVEGKGTFGDQVLVSDDGHRVAVYSYTSAPAPTTAAMSMNSMDMDSMDKNMGKSAVTFYDRRVRVILAQGEDNENNPDSDRETITWVQVAQLDHNDTGPVVAMSGDGTMIASAYPAGQSSSSIQRPIQTYRLTENERTGLIELMPVGSGLYITWDTVNDSDNSSSSQSDGDFGGTSLALSKDGTRMVVGAGGSSYGTPGGNYAVVYDLIDGEWAKTGNALHGMIFYKEDMTPASSSKQSRLDLCQENLGATVAMSSNGKRIALAAPNSYVCDLSRAGGVYVYGQDKDTNEWIQVGEKMQLEGIVRNDAIGSTLSISDDGNRLAIGTEGELAAVVEFNSVTQDWEIVGEVFNLYSEQPAADLLTKGVQVALSGDGMRLALTAPFGGPPSESDGMYATSGYVKVFEYNANDGKDQASAWKPVGRTVSFEDEFGTAADLSADGTTLVTGWRYYQSGNQTVVFDGLVRVYSAPDAVI